MVENDRMIIVKNRCGNCRNLVCRVYPPSEFEESVGDDMPESAVCSFCGERGMVETLCVCGECRTLPEHYSVKVTGVVREIDMEVGSLRVGGLGDPIIFDDKQREILLEAEVGLGSELVAICRLVDRGEAWQLLEVVMASRVG